MGLIALINDKPIGLAHTLAHRHGWYEEKTIYLQDLFVSKEARNMGVARALINEIYHQADKNNTPHVYWTTKRDNIAARRLYDEIAHNSGFIKYQR
jgi:ribosomal protein S18 acetylase RimI-like enzyme